MKKSAKSKMALFQGSLLNTCAKNTGPEAVPYENLANAIVKQAVRDWQDGYIDLYFGSDRTAWRMKECERFFHGEWIKMLTKVDGDYLLKLAKQQVIEHDYTRFWYHPRNNGKGFDM